MKSKIDNNLRNAKNIGTTIEKYLNIPSELKKAGSVILEESR